MVTSVLYDQFRALNTDFQLAVGHSGQFQASVREFRRRHQKLVQSVENADQFMMISNVSGFSLSILNLIFVLYCTIFFRDETINQDVISAALYAYWLAMALFLLALTVCQAVVINHMVCTVGLRLFRMKRDELRHAIHAELLDSFGRPYLSNGRAIGIRIFRRPSACLSVTDLRMVAKLWVVGKNFSLTNN